MIYSDIAVAAVFVAVCVDLFVFKNSKIIKGIIGDFIKKLKIVFLKETHFFDTLTFPK
jgi:hypothetical protein